MNTKHIPMRFVFIGKAKNLNFKELYLLWHFGRTIEPMESVDFSWN